MELLNGLSVDYETKPLGKKNIETLVKLIAPFAPYMAEELWHLSGNEDSVHVAEWPKADSKYLTEEESTVMVAINGKVRSELKVKTNEINNKEEILGLAKKDDKIINWLGDSEIVKEIYVPGKMINFVIKD